MTIGREHKQHFYKGTKMPCYGDILKWKTKRLDNLIVPLRSLWVRINHYAFQFPSTITKVSEDNAVWVQFGLCPSGERIQQKLANSGSLEGRLVQENKGVLVTDIELYGELTRTPYYDILIPLLRESKGILEASIVWNEDDVERTLLSVKDGKVMEKNVEL